MTDLVNSFFRLLLVQFYFRIFGVEFNLLRGAVCVFFMDKLILCVPNFSEGQNHEVQMNIQFCLIVSILLYFQTYVQFL